jgi:hypothetical protein
MSGKHYMPMRSLEQVTCQGSSDNVPVNAAEFREALDGAVRLARSFDDGLSECGLVCDMGILALDAAHDDMYAKLGLVKAAKPNTEFPCTEQYIFVPSPPPPPPPPASPPPPLPCPDPVAAPAGAARRRYLTVGIPTVHRDEDHLGATIESWMRQLPAAASDPLYDSVVLVVMNMMPGTEHRWFDEARRK